MIKEAIVKIVNKEDLTYDEAYAVMNEIMGGETTSNPECSFSCSSFHKERQRLRQQMKSQAVQQP